MEAVLALIILTILRLGVPVAILLGMGTLITRRQLARS